MDDEKKGNYIKYFNQFCKLVYNLIIIAIICFIVYLCFFIAYPRFFQIGHTESGFETFMNDYVKNITTSLIKLKNSNISQISTTKEAGIVFLKTYKKEFGIDLSNVKIEDVNINNKDFTAFFLLFMFFYDLQKGKTNNFQNAFDMLQTKLTGDALQVVKNLYNKKYASGPNPSYYALDDKEIKKFKKLINY